jgi:hypothetical protein
LETIGDIKMSVVMKHPEAKPSFKQKKAIYAISLALGYSQEKAKFLSAKPKTRGQASAIIKQLLKLKA